MADDPGALLERWLVGRGDMRDVQVTGRATIGLSQETWFVTLGERDAVLRLPTPASGPAAIRAQSAALRAVDGAVLAPELLLHDDGEDNPFGRPFLVMARVRGEVPVGWHTVDEPARTKLSEQAMDALAALHETPAPRGRDEPGPAELAFYEKRLRRFAPLPEVLEAALWWLRRHEPDRPAEDAFVHGDFRMGNLVVDGDSLTGVLDWEMAAPGDPYADLAWCFVPVWEPALVDEGMLVRVYAAARGIALDVERLRWHRILAYVRLSYYALSGTWAFDHGHSDDLRLAALRLQLPRHLDRLAATLAGEEIT